MEKRWRVMNEQEEVEKEENEKRSRADKERQ